MRELKIEAKLENLNTLLEFINAELGAGDCPPKIQTHIQMAAEEVFVNIVRYAYQPGPGPVHVRAAARGREMNIEFEDAGKPYNPLGNAEPDITVSMEDRPIGGLGVFLVKKLMDGVTYRFENNRNFLTLTKLIPPKPPQGGSH
jgi:anti-sigma regulatory factor (Ser/Thr protein kinase)